MKKVILIVGIILIIVLASVWAYLMFFSTSNGDGDIFAVFNFGDTTDTTILLDELNTPQVQEPTVDTISPETLRQLTARPVIGYNMVRQNASSSPIVYFVEAGTGHVYTIDLLSGEETRISNITISSARSADITSNGTYVAVKSGDGQTGSLTLITLPSNESSLSSLVLVDTSDNFVFDANNELLYSQQSGNTTLGKVYNPTSNTYRTLFEIPFREMMIDWGTAADGTHFAYPKASRELEGYLYRIIDSTLSRLPASGYGLSAKSIDGYSLYSVVEDGDYKTYLLNHDSGSSDLIVVSVLPEKCTFSGDEFIICGHSDSITEDLPDEWYQGIQISDENLIQIPLSNPFPTKLQGVTEAVGRTVDVYNLVAPSSGDRFLFKNRTSGNLWLYDTNVVMY